MFVSIRRKHIQMLVVMTILMAVTFSLFHTSWILSDQTSLMIKTKVANQFERLSSVFGSTSVDTTNPESDFNQRVEEILDRKASNDVENKFWLVDTTLHDQDVELTIPSYYFNTEAEHRPFIQPFDPRFTLGVYLHHIYHVKQNQPDKEIRVPFHWADWTDLSVLNKYLLAPTDQKPNCTFLDARMDAKKIKQEHDQYIKDLAEKAQKYLDEQNRKDREEAAKKAGMSAEEFAEAEAKLEAEKETKAESKEAENKENKESQENKDSETKENKQSENKEKRDGLHHFEKRGPIDPYQYCLDDKSIDHDHVDGNKVHPGFNVFQHGGHTIPEKAIITGKSYLYSYAPSPSNIIFLTSEGSYKIVPEKRASLIDNYLVDEYIRDTKESRINAITELRRLRKSFPPNSEQVISDYEVELQPADFILRHKEIIDEMENQIRAGKHLSQSELRYLQSLKYSEWAVANGGPPKYFSEARLVGTALGDHYDWRFFNGIMYGTYEQTLTLHRLVRAFLSFCRKNGITTWVAHGSLLSWYWNGVAFPWDNDVDVQMPVMDLHKLSMYFNQSLIVEDVEDGFGRYFVDCGTFITLREPGNHNNNIDARFIDVDTGLYIDITGLAVSSSGLPHRYRGDLPEGWDMDKHSNFETNSKMQAYNCRNNHYSRLNELSPLVKTYIEGEMGYVPKKFTNSLSIEYSKGMLSKKYRNHVFVPQLRLWVREEDLFYFLTDKEKWLKYHNYNEEYLTALRNELDDHNFEAELYDLKSKLPSLDLEKLQLSDDDLLKVFRMDYDQLLEFLTKDEVLMTYTATKEFTALHEEEIMRLLFGKSTEQIVNAAPDFRPMMYDPFLYNVKNNYVSYEARVSELENLIETYKDMEKAQATEPPAEDYD